MRKWKNVNGAEFYKKVPQKVLDALYAKGGMLSCPNGILSLCFFALNEDEGTTTLEIGAGWGRIISVLKNNGYKTKDITAVERNPLFANQLRQKFPDLNVSEEDIMQFQTEQKFDRIGCWYSVFLEFNPREQKKLLDLICYLSKPATIIVIDIIPLEVQSNATNTKGQDLKIQMDGLPAIHGYVPTLKALSRNANEAGLVMHSVPYWTDTGRKRVQCILAPKKSPFLATIAKIAKSKAKLARQKHEVIKNSQRIFGNLYSTGTLEITKPKVVSSFLKRGVKKGIKKTEQSDRQKKAKNYISSTYKSTIKFG